MSIFHRDSDIGLEKNFRPSVPEPEQQYRVALMCIVLVGSIGAFLLQASRAVNGSVHGCMAWWACTGVFIFAHCTCTRTHA